MPCPEIPRCRPAGQRASHQPYAGILQRRRRWALAHDSELTDNGPNPVAPHRPRLGRLRPTTSASRGWHRAEASACVGNSDLAEDSRRGRVRPGRVSSPTWQCDSDRDAVVAGPPARLEGVIGQDHGDDRIGRMPGASMQRSLPRTTTTPHRRGERGTGYRPASSQRGTASYTWDEPSTASLQCDSCGGEKGGPNRTTHRRTFIQQRPAGGARHPRRGPGCARVRPRRPALSPRVPRSRTGPAVCGLGASRSAQTGGVRPLPQRSGEPLPWGRRVLTRCRVARGEGTGWGVERRCRLGGATAGLASPAPAAPDRRRVGPRRRAVPARG